MGKEAEVSPGAVGAMTLLNGLKWRCHTVGRAELDSIRPAEPPRQNCRGLELAGEFRDIV